MHQPAQRLPIAGSYIDDVIHLSAKWVYYRISSGRTARLSDRVALESEVYGLPEYLSAIPSTLLNESATLFRHKYYLNGNYAGFIMYMTDNAHNQAYVNNIRQAIKNTKGLGNLRNLFIERKTGF